MTLAHNLCYPILIRSGARAKWPLIYVISTVQPWSISETRQRANIDKKGPTGTYVLLAWVLKRQNRVGKIKSNFKYLKSLLSNLVDSRNLIV
jgi:hypothetical protein